jgi:hypothetical protein
MILMIGHQNLLMQTSHGWLVLKIDYKSWEIIVVSDVFFPAISVSFFLIDQLNEQNLLIYNRTSFATGSLIGNQIVFNPRRELNLEYLFYSTLIGNYLYGIWELPENDERVIAWKYFKLDMITLAKETTDVSFVLDDGIPIQILYVGFLFLLLIPANFSFLCIAGLGRDCMVFFPIDIIRYFNYMFDFR